SIAGADPLVAVSSCGSAYRAIIDTNNSFADVERRGRGVEYPDPLPQDAPDLQIALQGQNRGLPLSALAGNSRLLPAAPQGRIIRLLRSDGIHAPRLGGHAIEGQRLDRRHDPAAGTGWRRHASPAVAASHVDHIDIRLFEPVGLGKDGMK